jgi:hypothetical protein
LHFSRAALRSRLQSFTWAAGIVNLRTGFDTVSVTRSSGSLMNCIWNFGGSYTTIAKSGDLAVVSETWRCPVADTGDAIRRPLPGGTSAYDSIAACVTR